MTQTESAAQSASESQVPCLAHFDMQASVSVVESAKGAHSARQVDSTQVSNALASGGHVSPARKAPRRPMLRAVSSRVWHAIAASIETMAIEANPRRPSMRHTLPQSAS